MQPKLKLQRSLTKPLEAPLADEHLLAPVKRPKPLEHLEKLRTPRPKKKAPIGPLGLDEVQHKQTLHRLTTHQPLLPQLERRDVRTPLKRQVKRVAERVPAA